MGQELVEHGCLRRVVVVYNAFFWVTGPGMIGLGIWLYISIGEYEPVVQQAEFSPPAFIIISAGGASLLAGLLGCLGSVNENRRLLALYSILMVVVCAAEITSAVFCFLTHDKAELKINSMLNNTLADYSIIRDVTNTWDSIHTQGCGPALVDWLRNIHIIAGWTAAGVAASMILALSAVCCLKHALTGFYI